MLVSVLTLTINTVKAQDTTMTTMSTMSKSTSSGMSFKVGLGVSGGITHSASPYDYVLGADFLMQWTLMENLALTGSIGYNRFMGGNGADLSFLPAVGGVKVYPGIGKMYLAANVGAGLPIEDGGKLGFVFGGGLGYDWESGFSLGARYEGWQQDSSTSTYLPVHMSQQFALRIGYNFKL